MYFCHNISGSWPQETMSLSCEIHYSYHPVKYKHQKLLIYERNMVDTYINVITRYIDW